MDEYDYAKLGGVFLILIIILYLGIFKENAYNGTLVTLHYTDWCSYCKNMKPIWEEVKKQIKVANPSIHFREVNEDKTPTEGIQGYPTIMLLDQHGRRFKYPGDQNMNKLKNWILAPVH